MADIRINALATTATSSASDDYVAIDGSANGTRKLSAYSPTFGGNLTVNGNAATVASTGASAELVLKRPSTSYGSQISFNNGSTNEWFMGSMGGGSQDFRLYNNVAGNTAIQFNSSTSTATLGGNLTVSGTGTSSVAGSLNVTGGGGTASLLNGGLSFTGENFKSGNASGYLIAVNKTTNNGIYWDTSANTLSLFTASGGGSFTLTQGGNLLLGTTTDSGNGKLQIATHTTSAGGIGFGTDVSLYRYDAGQLLFNHVGGTNAQLFISNSGTIRGLFQAYGTGSQVFMGAYSTGWSTIITSGAGTTALTLDSSQNCTVVGYVRGANVVASDLGSSDKGFFGTAGGAPGVNHRLALVRTDTPSGGSALLSAFGAIAFEVGATTGLNNGTRAMTITSTGKVNMSSLPTSSSGLSAGDIWNDSGTLKIV